MDMDKLKQELLKRRAFLIAPFAFAGLVAVSSKSAPSNISGDANEDVTIVEFSNDGKRLRTSLVKKVRKTEGEWRRQLSAEQLYVTRHGSTDTPFTGTYYQMHTAGMFRCVCCGTALFRSHEKFDSGTGWPSFWAPAAEENIRKIKDTSMFMERVEVRCRRCDAHQGHVFDDGPAPTGMRYCINESSLHFVAA